MGIRVEPDGGIGNNDLRIEGQDPEPKMVVIIS